VAEEVVDDLIEVVIVVVVAQVVLSVESKDICPKSNNFN
jgi:hypothetical protein